MLDLIRIIESHLGIKLPIIYKEARLGDMKDSFADISKLQAIGYKPQNTVSEGMKKYIKYCSESFY